MPPSAWIGSTMMQHAVGCSSAFVRRIEIAVRDVLDRLDERAEVLAVLRLPGDRDRRERAAVEAADASRRSSCAAARRRRRLVAARELQRALVRFRAPVAEEHAVGERAVDDRLRGEDLLVVVVEVRDVDELPSCVGTRAREHRVRVAEPAHRDARGHVEVALAARRPTPRSPCRARARSAAACCS